jgi:hypothetical protein
LIGFLKKYVVDVIYGKIIINLKKEEKQEEINISLFANFEKMIEI